MNEFMPFEVSKPLSQLAEAMYKLAACSKSELCYLVIATRQHMVFSIKNGILFNYSQL